MKEIGLPKSSDGTRRCFVRTFTVVAMLMLSAFVQGETKVWTGGSGNWSEAEGFSPITVTGSLTVTDGASINVDFSGYTGDLGSFRVFNVESVVGDLLDVDVSITMNGEELTKPRILRRTDSGIDLVIMTGTLILFK